MRKWIVGLFILLAVFIGSIYIFIPTKVTITHVVSVNANREATYRYISQQQNWKQWWPGASNDSLFTYNDVHFKLTGLRYNTLDITIQTGTDTTKSLLTLIAPDMDSLQMLWNAEVFTGTNPFTRWQRYSQAKKMSAYCDTILQVLKRTVSDIKNVYGVTIKKEKIPYEFVLSKKLVYTNYPTPQQVYEVVDQLREHIIRKGGKADGIPMLHVETKDSIHYETQIAVPIATKLPDEGEFSSKWLMKDGYIFTAEVTGGIHTVETGFLQIEKFIEDHQLTEVAIPFQSLVTDRVKETDSTKWITKLYYPVVIF